MEILENFKDTLYKRVKSSFGGTLILVWSIYNWKLIYALFNFDKGTNLQLRVGFINRYIIQHKFWDLLFWPVLSSVLSITLFTLFTYLVYGISSFFQFRVGPKILKTIDNDQIVSKERFDFVQKQYSELQSKQRNSQEEHIKNIKEIERLSAENTGLHVEIADLISNAEDFRIERENFSKALDEEKNKSAGLKVKLDSNIKIGLPDGLFEFGDWRMKFGKESQGFTDTRIKVKKDELIVVDLGETFKILNVYTYGANFLTFELQSTRNRSSKKYFLTHKGDSHYLGFDNHSDTVSFYNTVNLVAE